MGHHGIKCCLCVRVEGWRRGMRGSKRAASFWQCFANMSSQQSLQYFRCTEGRSLIWQGSGMFPLIQCSLIFCMHSCKAFLNFCRFAYPHQPMLYYAGRIAQSVWFKGKGVADSVLCLVTGPLSFAHPGKRRRSVEPLTPTIGLPTYREVLLKGP